MAIRERDRAFGQPGDAVSSELLGELENEVTRLAFDSMVAITDNQ